MNRMGDEVESDPEVIAARRDIEHNAKQQRRLTRILLAIFVGSIIFWMSMWALSIAADKVPEQHSEPVSQAHVAHSMDGGV
ncbi:MAG: hypothetical protein RL430_1554 [Actinomycetota bacterium]|jgi:Sec-independent protein secretion pathway component TatC